MAPILTPGVHLISKPLEQVQVVMGFPGISDVSPERYWTLVSEMEVPNMQSFEDMMAGKGMTSEAMKEFEDIMKDYHELVESGRREIYKIEA